MDNQNWFERHPVATVLIAFMFLTAFVGNTSETKRGDVVTPEKSIVAQATEEPTHKTVSKESCNSVVVGMTSQEAASIMGEPKSSSESDLGGLGKSRYWHYQEGLSFDACGIMIMDGKVSSVTWTSL